MAKPSEYHLRELAIINTPGDPRRNLPKGVQAGCRILDVGCGIGQSLTASEFAGCVRYGVDIDPDAIAAGTAMFPELSLTVAPAEQLPYPDSNFDLVYSRVAIPYTNVRMALRELVRVTRPNGQIWLSLHPWSMEKKEIFDAIRNRSVRRTVDRAYVFLNSVLLATTGRSVARPWSGLYESFQFQSRIKSLLSSLGCENITTSTDVFFIVSANRKKS